MMSLILRSLILLSIILILCIIALAEVKQLKSACSWRVHVRDSKCPDGLFHCLNSDTCITRKWYCDGGNDCGDNSDERYCSTSDPCPTNPLFYRCKDSTKCIPFEWTCDGYHDCPYQEDELNCISGTNLSISPILDPQHPNLEQTIRLRNAIAQKVFHNWLYNQKMKNSSEIWRTNIDRLALMLYLAGDNFSASQQNETINEIAYELKFMLLSQLTRMKLQDIPSIDLASYLNAFLVMCVNPRDFYEYDIVQELRNRVDKENYTNPYVLLALCNAGEIITESDQRKLIDNFWNIRRTFWTDMRAVVVMALACANKQPENEVDSETLQEMTLELKQRQYRNGIVENLPTTALVMQALISTDSESDPDNFEEVKAFEVILRSQKSDGSFGDLMNTFLVAPVLTCRSLVDINSDHCHYGSRDEISALEKLSKRSGPKIRVLYSIWIRDEKDLERNLILKVPENTSLCGVMEIAAEVDSHFKFEYSVKNSKKYINTVSGMRDNPLTGKFWFLYTIQNGEPTLSSKKGPAEIIPRDKDQFAMWYRRGTWVD